MSNSGNWQAEKRVAGRGRKFTKAERAQVMATFLEALGLSGVIVTACRAAGISRQLVDYWNEHDAEFNVRYGIARREADDRIRAEIHRRAIVGTERPVYHAGKLVGHIREYSDTLLIFLAKARMPEEFREKVERRPEHDTIPLSLIDEVLDDARAN